MATRFLELGDGILVEVEAPPGAREEMHSSVIERVDTSMEMVGKVVRRVLDPVRDAFVGLSDTLDVPIRLDAAEVEIGLSFSAEGSIFVTTSKAEGTLKIKATFKPAEPAKGGGAGPGAGAGGGAG